MYPWTQLSSLQVFGNCLELRPALGQMLDPAAGRPTRLELLVGESHPTFRDVGDRTAASLSGLPVAPVVVEVRMW